MPMVMLLNTKVRSPGSATVINAISTGYGSAFGIKLYVNAEVKFKGPKSSILCETDSFVDTKLMELCVEKVIERFGILRIGGELKYLDLQTGVSVKTTSTLPAASGLSSSSATSNAVVMATARAIMNEYGFELEDAGLNELDLLNLAIDASLEAGVTITGAFDDASASFFGGLTVTDNMKRKILQKKNMEEQNILIHMPDRKSPTAKSDVGRMKLLAPWVKMAFDEALNGRIYSALTLNGLLYCSALGFDSNIALDALDAGAVAAGLSGTGPSFVAVANNRNADKVEESWSSYPGRVIRTGVDNEGTKVVRSG